MLMSGWNYRLLKSDDHIRLIEAYYDNDGRITGWCPASPPNGDTYSEVVGDLGHMIRALGDRILSPVDLESDMHLIDEYLDTPEG